MTSIDARLTQLGIELPEAMAPAGQYVPAVRAGDLLFLSGTGPVRPDGSLVTGKVGGDLDLDAGREGGAPHRACRSWPPWPPSSVTWAG